MPLSAVRKELPELQWPGLDYGENEFLYLLVYWIGGGEIVNLGDGASATYMALSLQDHNLPGSVTTIDFYSREKRDAHKNERRRLGVRDRVIHLRERTDEARLRLEGCTFGLGFIDADHSYRAARKDIEMYAPLVTGYLAFHDTNQDDVDRALRDCMQGWELVFWVNRIKVFRRAG